ncbi:MAG: hypothetical protein Kow0062_05780 [Acidobacteriota bacterium]
MSAPPRDDADRTLPFLSAVIRRGWTWTRRIAIAAVLVGGAVILLEAVHLHELLARIHPWLAWTVSGTLLAALLAFLGWAGVRWARIPTVVRPPDLPPPERGWTPRQRRAYLRFAERYLARQEANEALPLEVRQRIPGALERLLALGRTAEDDTVLVAEVEAEIDLLLEPLDRRARREIWQSATQIAVLTAVNPSALLDVMITLLRNVELMARLAKLYYGRPGLAGTLGIVRDVLAVAATAGIVEKVADGLTDALAEVAGSWTTRLAGPVGQGLTNGILTIRLGEAAQVRCRSLRSRRVGIKPWSRAMWREAARRLAAAVAGRSRDLEHEFEDLSPRPRGIRRGFAKLRAWWSRPAAGTAELSVPEDDVPGPGR